MKIQSKIKLNHKGEQSEVGYINLLQDGYLTIDNLERGDYVLTMYVQCDSIGNISIGEQSQDITTSWNKVSYILSNVENIINIKFKKGVYYIYEVKLEKGNKATDWTPAPEDISVENVYTPNTTTIDGGKITTGSIKAAQIAAGTITSNEIAAGTITSNEIAAGTITSNEIAAGTITADKINLNDLFAQNITATGTITGATLTGANIEATSGKIGVWNIETNNLSTSWTYNTLYRTIALGSSASILLTEKNSSTTYKSDSETSIDGGLVQIVDKLSTQYSAMTSSSIYVGDISSNYNYCELTPTGIIEKGMYLENKYILNSNKYTVNGVSHTGWLDIDQSKVPTLNFLSFWNGAHTSNGNSNLSYCNRGAFGTIVTKSASDYLPSASSDIRLKDNVNDTEVDNALEVVNQMKLRSFDWNDGSHPHQKIGFVADELEEIDSRLAVGGGWNIATNPDGNEEKVMNVKTVDIFYMMGYVVKAIQELSEKIQELKDA